MTGCTARDMLDTPAKRRSGVLF